ncbi:MazG nucleotide pyrophosphohydrolase domain-containing protein [Pseudalkalibacillus sp. Hm43]|uniref:MazG nucleotide pyrophosphohydrolase domain-containing protein n=1 Tax=Pseudalkalibacillus sp. Hm43 TaxID=3450742 RepID=UPI003F438537
MNSKLIEELTDQMEKDRGWVDEDAYYKMNLLIEEVGELAREVRRRETGRLRPDEDDTVDNRDDLELEVGDVLFSLISVSNHYKISLDRAFLAKLNDLKRRYNSSIPIPGYEEINSNK